MTVTDHNPVPTEGTPSRRNPGGLEQRQGAHAAIARVKSPTIVSHRMSHVALCVALARVNDIKYYYYKIYRMENCTYC